MSTPSFSLMDASSLALTPLDTHEIPVARLKVRATPDEEAAILLTLAAEVEHALMTQYLYAAYSVQHQDDRYRLRNQSTLLRRYMFQLAREEMGHLITVQNLLRLIDAPLYLGRMTEPTHPGTVPFRYTLEPLSTRSLAKYITAERPHHVADPVLRARLEHIADIAQEANAGEPVLHVGAIYERLYQIFSSAALDDRHFHDDGDDLQARWDDWGYDDTDLSQADSRKVLVCHAARPSPDTGSLRDQALAALQQITEQGEGYTGVPDCHYQRLLEVHDMVGKLEAEKLVYCWPVAVNPTTHPPDASTRLDVQRGQAPVTSYIESASSRSWAQLLNLRYQLLLGYTRHFLQSSGPRYEESGVSECLGDYTSRGLLLRGAFDEMRHLRKIAMKLVTMPLRDGDDSVHAGPPFELGAPGEPIALDTTTATAAGGASAPPAPAWAHHLALLRASAAVIQPLLSGEASPNPFLQDLERADRQTMEALEALATGQAIPCHLHPRNFQKVASIMEQAARGFTVPGHGNFWTGITCPEFAALSFYGMRYLGYAPSDPKRFCADTALLVTAITGTGTMPRHRPQIPAVRQDFIRSWIDAQAPDGDLPDRIGAHHERSAIDDDEPE